MKNVMRGFGLLLAALFLVCPSAAQSKYLEPADGLYFGVHIGIELEDEMRTLGPAVSLAWPVFEVTAFYARTYERTLHAPYPFSAPRTVWVPGHGVGAQGAFTYRPPLAVPLMLRLGAEYGTREGDPRGALFQPFAGVAGQLPIREQMTFVPELSGGPVFSEEFGSGAIMRLAIGFVSGEGPTRLVVEPTLGRSWGEAGVGYELGIRMGLIGPIGRMSSGN
jgi:hypothetical protein